MEKKDSEKKPIPWEVGDPKVPVIRSGHFENKKENNNRMVFYIKRKK
mgnify:CR=1 FL=1